ncbi:MAG: mannitol dehydrogenase family protein, partial [Lachnospiraceae bacterium]|nr:mannitol dehydrogenase family protein [Lachnospiraceae bacterium]
MKLNLSGIQAKYFWEDKGISLPSYDIESIVRNTKDAPVWVHFGIGNIFRIFIGGLADTLLEKGFSSKGITCVETFDFDVVDKIYTPYDNLVLGVTLNTDGSTQKRVIASLTEAIKAQSAQPDQWNRLKTIFGNSALQMISFTITEKGYALKDASGTYFPFIQKDIDLGPAAPGSAMAIVCALLYHRYQNGKTPIAVVSMDNCSHNGEKLQASILTIAKEWAERGFVTEGFLDYLSDETQVSFPWSMIDKITPRPADSVCSELEGLGIEDIAPVVTSRNTYIAPFVNAEAPQYLVIEDKFPNGRPMLEKAGVYFTDRETVNKVERMKVTTCLNPLHTALAVYGCILGYDLIADEMKDEQLNSLVHQIGPVEGMPVVTDPGILSPEDFVNEVINVRLPNPFMPDTPQRIATDTSQKVGIRYGETIKSYVELYGDAKKLKAIPLAIAGWCRYLLGVDDQGQVFTLSPDPMAEELTSHLNGIVLGQPDTYNSQLGNILSNENIFDIDLYKAGVGEFIEELFL